MAIFAKGADISRWQDVNSTPEKVDFNKMKANGLDFVFIKASQAAWVDEDYLWNWNEAVEPGLLRGAYHFLVWDVNPITQADFFCDLLEHDPGELPPIADFEWWNTTPSTAYQVLHTFVQTVEANLGIVPGIYTAPGFWNPYGTQDAFWKHYPLWVAHWGVQSPIVPAPWETWKFWQYTASGDGHLYGAESAEIDLNFYNGTTEDLYVEFGIVPPPPPPPPPDVDFTELKNRVERLENLLVENAENTKENLAV